MKFQVDGFHQNDILLDDLLAYGKRVILLTKID